MTFPRILSAADLPPEGSPIPGTVVAGRVDLPHALKGVFFDFLWETSKSWLLPTPPSAVLFDDLAWHLDLTVWTTVQGQPKFDLSPSTVLRMPEEFPQHWQRIMSADLAYPLEMFQNDGRWVILDGYHRLARARVEGRRDVQVRLHPDACKGQILRDK